MDPVAPQTSNCKAHVARILAQPGSFKICESCNGIVVRRGAVCPVCSGYRFRSDPDEIIQRVRILGAGVRQGIAETEPI